MASDGVLVEDVTRLNLQSAADSNTGQREDAAVVEDTTLTPELREKVFGNELIRNRIFDYLISSDRRGDKLAFKNLFICRLVDHAWLEYVSRRLQSPGSPTYNLSFGYCRESNENQNSLPTSSIQIQKFLDIGTTFAGAGRRVPLYELHFYPSFGDVIELIEVQDLVKCLMECGHGLYGLNIHLSKRFLINDENAEHTDFLADIGQLDLPNLMDLDIFLPKYEANPLVSLMIPSILSGCTQLKKLALWRQHPIKKENKHKQVALSRIFSETEQLPDTLENILIVVNMTSGLLANLLLNNSLPNLTDICLVIFQERLNDVISKILKRFSLQLHRVTLEEGSNTNLTFTLIEFAVMKKLKYMTVDSYYSEQKSEKELFPVLENLRLDYQSATNMLKWTKKSRFNCLKDLYVKMQTDNFADNFFSVELSKQLHVSFPHLQKLDLTIRGRVETGSINNIFQHMTQLYDLRLRLVNTQDALGVYTWDATLLGVTTDYAKQLAEYPLELLHSTNLNHHREPTRSIVNLSRLNTLLLSAYTDAILKISDISFWLAFLRMPNLHNLMLINKFRASSEMAEEWHRRGRRMGGDEYC